MNIDIELFKEAINYQADEKPIFNSSPSIFYAKWVEGLSIPKELKDFLLYFLLSDEYRIGTAVLYTPDQILTENQEFLYILNAGFIIIGSAPNGDMIAIEYLRTHGETGYLSHDNLWEWDVKSRRNPHEYFLSLAMSVGKFALKAVKEKEFPMDYYGTIPDHP